MINFIVSIVLIMSIFILLAFIGYDVSRVVEIVVNVFGKKLTYKESLVVAV